jgi:hypothetical protein
VTKVTVKKNYARRRWLYLPQVLYRRSTQNRIEATMKIFALITLLLISATIFTSVSLVSQVKAEGDVIILSDTIYQNYGYAPFSISKGDYIVAGEVQNVGAEALHFNITAVFYDASGNVIGSSFLSDSSSDTSPCYLHVLLPGRSSPFTVWFSRFDETGLFRVVDHYSLQVSTSSAGVFHSGFAIVSDTSHEADGSLYVEGDLKNIGTNYIDGYNVFATFYKENGDVLAVSMEGGAYTRVDPVTGERGFPPNQTAYFSMALNGFNEGGRLEEFSRYELTAEGYDYSLWSSDGHLINPEVVYVLGVVQEQVEPVDTEDFPFIAIIAAATAIVVVLIVAFLVLKRSRKGSLQKPA